jgi:hypothetical protein
VSFSLSDAANGLRNLFSQVVGSDVANNPHVLTRTYAKGLTLSLSVMGSNGGPTAVPVAGVSVAVQVQAQNPDGSWTTVAQYTGGPSAANGGISFSDSQTVFDLTKVYQVVGQGTFPDGTSETAPALPFWAGARSPLNWGQGFSLIWLTAYVLGTSTSTTQGVSILAYPMSGNYPLYVQATAYPAAGGTGLTFAWYSTSTGNAVIATGQSVNLGFAGTQTIYCVMTDSTGTTYTSNRVVVTVNNAPPARSP